jgi:hypothetical protein
VTKDSGTNTERVRKKYEELRKSDTGRQTKVIPDGEDKSVVYVM